MFPFNKQAGHTGVDTIFSPVSPYDSDEALQARIGQLNGDEYEIYKWLREFYSERWIAETLLLKRREVNVKIKNVFFTLGVKNKRALIRCYGCLERPQKGPVDTGAIDKYIDLRTEKSIQSGLKKSSLREGGNENG